jgi:hypothetical protein
MALVIRSRWARVVAAAARLAAIYSVGVAILLLIGSPVLWRGTPSLRAALNLAIPIGFLFGVAFLLLAGARRVGFVVMWLGLIAMWIYILSQGIVDVRLLFVPSVFYGWTVFALPLYAMGAIGVSPRKPVAIGRRRVSLTTLVLLVWGVLAASALFFLYLGTNVFIPDTPYRRVAEVARFLWIPAPLVVSVLAIVHVWRGTAPPPRAIEGDAA